MKTTKILAGILMILLAGLLIFCIFKFSAFIEFILIYPFILSKMTGIIINPHLAAIAALLVTAGLYYGVYQGIYKRNKNLGLACVIGLLVLQSSAYYFSEKDRFYSLTTGEAIKYYTTNPITGEIQVFDRDIYDAFGQKAQPVDSTITQEIYRQENGEKLPNSEVPIDKVRYFFNIRTGEAMVYYTLDSKGVYHLYLHGGHDQNTGLKLQPVNSSIVQDIKDKASKLNVDTNGSAVEEPPGEKTVTGKVGLDDMAHWPLSHRIILAVSHLLLLLMLIWFARNQDLVMESFKGDPDEDEIYIMPRLRQKTVEPRIIPANTNLTQEDDDKLWYENDLLAIKSGLIPSKHKYRSEWYKYKIEESFVKKNGFRCFKGEYYVDEKHQFDIDCLILSRPSPLVSGRRYANIAYMHEINRLSLEHGFGLIYMDQEKKAPPQGPARPP